MEIPVGCSIALTQSERHNFSMRLLCIVVTLQLGIFILVGCDDDSRPNGDGSELMRVTSPNGYLDAVLMMYTYGGAAGGGIDSNVYIARKGAPVIAKPGHA